MSGQGLQINYPSNLSEENVKSICRIRSFDYHEPLNFNSANEGSGLGEGMAPVQPVDPSKRKMEIRIASPIQLQSNYNFSYREESTSTAQNIAALTTLTGGTEGGFLAAQRLSRGVLDAALPAFGRMVEIGLGTAANPMTVLMFNGPTHRQFNLNFIMKPKSEEDADAMLTIIQQMKQGAHPAVAGQDTDLVEPGQTVPLYFRYPDFYLLDFMYQNENSENWDVNPHIYSTKRCFCEAINVTYHNAGTQSYFKRNGIPTAVGLALVFKEYNVITREHIQNVENSGGAMNQVMGG